MWIRVYQFTDFNIISCQYQQKLRRYNKVAPPLTTSKHASLLLWSRKRAYLKSQWWRGKFPMLLFKHESWKMESEWLTDESRQYSFWASSFLFPPSCSLGQLGPDLRGRWSSHSRIIHHIYPSPDRKNSTISIINTKNTDTFVFIMFAVKAEI